MKIRERAVHHLNAKSTACLFTIPKEFLSFPFLVAVKLFAASLEPKISELTVACSLL